MSSEAAMRFDISVVEASKTDCPVMRRKTAILRDLRSCSPRQLKNEEALFSAVKHALLETLNFDGPREAKHERYVWLLGLAYTAHFGKMPAFSNSDNETVFERLALKLSEYANLSISRSQVKTAVRKLDPRRNVVFLLELQRIEMGEQETRLQPSIQADDT